MKFRLSDVFFSSDGNQFGRKFSQQAAKNNQISKKSGKIFIYGNLYNQQKVFSINPFHLKISCPTFPVLTLIKLFRCQNL